MSPIYLKMPGKGDDIATVLSKIILGSLIVKGLAKSSKAISIYLGAVFCYLLQNNKDNLSDKENTAYNNNGIISQMNDCCTLHTVHIAR